MVVATFTAVAKVVTPTVVPTVVPTALMHQNKAIAAAATTLASSLRGPLDLLSAREGKTLFPIRAPVLSVPTSDLDQAAARFGGGYRRHVI
jgi:hypothetical protein